MQRLVLRPVAPYLVLLFAEVLRHLVPVELGNKSTGELQMAEVEDEHSTQDVKVPKPSMMGEPVEDQQSLVSAVEGAAEVGSSVQVTGSARHKKHCIRIAVDVLHQLFTSFPGFVDTWKVLLTPVGPALQLLLSAAVETGAAGHATDVKGHDKSPAVVRFVASWACQAEYFVLYEQVLPQALPTLLGAIGSASVLQYLQRSKRSTTPLLEAAVETALLLSFGGRTKEQHEEELRVARREFNAMKQVNERKRRRRGYQSSSSEEESDPNASDAEGQSFDEGDKEKCLKSFKEAHMALQRQQERQQQQGMCVLLPHIGLLLHSLELLLRARSGAAIVKPRKDVDLNDESIFPIEEAAAPSLDQPTQASLNRRERALLVGFKELQLLTRLASYASADQHLLPKVHQSMELRPFWPEEHVPTAAKLIRLLLLSLPLRVRSGGAAARQQLTLSAIQGLLPAVARWRQALDFTSCSSNHMGELRALLHSLRVSCCGLLESAEDLQCRAAASEVLIGTELAACGCEVKIEDLLIRIRGYVHRELDDSRRAEEEEDSEQQMSSLSWLLPGGALNSSLLKNALPSLLFQDGEHDVFASCTDLASAWRVSVALVVVCANLLRAGGGAAPDEHRPDVDMQVLVLLALVEKYLNPPALAGCPQQDITDRKVCDEPQTPLEVRSIEAKQEGGEQFEVAIEEEGNGEPAASTVELLQGPPATEDLSGIKPQRQARPGMYIPASALEPLLHHVLYLLSDCSDDLALQQVALTFIRKAAVALGAAASAAVTRRAAAQFAPQLQQGAGRDEQEEDWIYAVGMQHHLARLIVPHLRLLLRSLREDVQRMALRALDAVIRTLGPAGPLLPPLQASNVSENRGSATLFFSESDEKQRNMRLHLDLYALLTPTKVTPAVEEAVARAQQLVSSGEACQAAVAAATAARLEAIAGEQQASEREEGGDVLLELLHMQKHRRARGLQLLSKAAAARRLCPNTLRHICVPVALWALLQESDLGSLPGKRKTSSVPSRHSRGHAEAFSQQMAEQGVACLTKCCRLLPLKCCTHTLTQLVSFLVKVPQREAFIHRAIASTLRAFPFGLSDAVHETLSQPHQAVNQEQDGRGATPSNSDPLKRAESSYQVHFRKQAGTVGMPITGEAEDEETSTAYEVNDTDGATGVQVPHCSAATRKQKVASCIRNELIPLLYRLAFDNKVRRVSSKGEASRGPGKEMDGHDGKTYENPVVRTELVAVLALLARMLPPDEFHLQLPRLVRTIAFALRSRERSARREARVALTHLAVNLGRPYFAYLVTELLRTNGPKNEKDAAANQQGFIRPVLLYTLHAMLNALVQDKSTEPEMLPPLADEGATTIDARHFIQRFEASVPLLLPLISDEICRVADPDSLEQEESRRLRSVQIEGEEAGPVDTSIVTPDDGSKRSRIEEAQTLKGPPTMLLLAKESSAECLGTHLLPFLLGLLTGSSCRGEGWNRGAAFSNKYVNRAEDLLLHFVFGLSRNKYISPECKLRTTKKLLILTVATLQFPLLHPILQAERSLDESLYLLAWQHLLLLERKKNAKALHRTYTSRQSPGELKESESAATSARVEEANDEQTTAPPSLSSVHQEDLCALRRLLLPEREGEDIDLLVQRDTVAGLTSYHRGDLASQHSRKLLVSLIQTRMERRVTLQPGAVTGRSLAQATRNKTAPGGGGLDLSTRAAVLGTAALRLLHLTLRAVKIPLRKYRERQLGTAPLRDAAHTNATGMDDGALQRCVNELDELALEVVCCFSCKVTKLVSWGARCLLELLALRLPRLDNRGALVAYLTMRVFHSCGNGTSVLGAHCYTARSELLPVSTKLLAVLLLQPQAAKWMDTALNPSQHIGGDILRSLLREQLRILPWRYQTRQQRGWQDRNGAAVSGASKADSGFSVSLAVTEEQIQAAGQFFLKEALLAHISSSLEDNHLQLCALFLLKRVVLQHYKDLAGSAARRAIEESQQTAGTMDSKALQRHAQKKRRRDAKEVENGPTPGEQHSTAAVELLPLVYECVDRVARVMVQHATASALSRKLSNICADVYVSFLLNFPMTPKLQQRRVFFLFQQQKFSDVYGRRAAIWALLKVVQLRFPAELFLERYAQVALLTCCSTLATETDHEVYAMLQQVVGEVLKLTEVEEDRISSLLGILQTTSKGVPQNALASFLPTVLELLSGISFLISGRQPLQFPDVSEDWRLLYKTLLVVEKIMAASGLPLMEESFAQAAKIWQSSGCEKLRALATALSVDAEEAEIKALQRQNLEAFIATLDLWDPPTENPKKRRTSPDTTLQMSPQQQQQVVTGLYAAHIWTELSGSALRHQNAWVRCSALRAVGQYLQQTPLTSGRQTGMPILALLAVRRCPEDKPVSAAHSSPLTQLGLTLGQHFGKDCMLERHPRAGPYAVAALIAWAQLAFTVPQLMPVTRKPRTEIRLKFRVHENKTFGQRMQESLAKDESGERDTLLLKEADEHQLGEVSDSNPGEATAYCSAVASDPLGSCHDSTEQTDSNTVFDEDAEVQPVTEAAGATALVGVIESKNSSKDSAPDGDADEDNSSSGINEEDIEEEVEANEVEKWVMDELQLEASQDCSKTSAAGAGARSPSLRKLPWNVSFSEREETDKTNASSLVAKLHPLVFLVAGLSRWLRVHLSRLGYSGGRIKETDAAPGTVVRVAGILTFFGTLLKLLPLAKLQNASEGPKPASQLSVVLHEVLRHIADAAYRCSTLQTEMAAESVLAQLLDDEALFKGDTGKQLIGDPSSKGDSPSLWDSLRGLTPVKQLIEVATGGAAVLRRMEQLLRSNGHEETYRLLLAKTRQCVSAKRAMRKLKVQQTFLQNPQAHAQRKRRRNQAKVNQKKTKLRDAILRRKGFVKRKVRAE
ncbi:hypothetical protein cyc_08231 [Cyclospora cayetanensis]|uniref:U3 small nucleolar RNA-associated protein 20 domain-containing protein n=1 Tax=Cyclospora cayetanensis TaxID=88456 RepID=A0A1D3D0E8_9EIME|nr:hypothetical protein cyc_08231 [Cyclospora cayetanensis]